MIIVLIGPGGGFDGSRQQGFSSESNHCDESFVSLIPGRQSGLHAHNPVSVWVAELQRRDGMLDESSHSSLDCASILSSCFDSWQHKSIGIHCVCVCGGGGGGGEERHLFFVLCHILGKLGEGVLC